MTKPMFSIVGRPSSTIWGLIGQVSRCLKQHGHPDAAREFRTRAFAMDVDEEDTSDLLGLILDYVTVW